MSVRLGGFSGLDAAGHPSAVPEPGGTAPNEAMEDERGEASDPLESDAGPMPPPLEIPVPGCPEAGRAGRGVSD